LALAAALTVTACAAPKPAAPAGEQPAATEQAAAPAAEGEKIELRVYILCGPPVEDSYNMMLAGFEKEHPNVTVKKECNNGAYDEQIFAMAAAGNLPDVFFSADLFTVPFVANDIVLDMKPLDDAQGSKVFPDVYPSILGLGQVPGSDGVYMIPASLDTVQVYYNVDMFKKAGIDAIGDDWTWDQLIDGCKKVQETNPDVYCIGKYTGLWWAYVVPWIVGYGGDVLSKDGTKSTLSSPESVAGLTAYSELWTTDKVAAPPGVDLGPDCFLGQKCALWLHIPGQMKNQREKATFNWDVALIPAHPKARVTGMGTYGFSIAKNTKHPEVAWDFVKMMASPEGQRIQLRGYTGIPLLKSMAADPAFDELTPPPANIKAFVKGGDVGIFPRQDYPAKCGSLYAGLVNSTLTAMVDALQYGKETAQEAAAKADETIQKCIDENSQ
jgi:multiple sugar transport system substrate-binding protein